MDGQNKLTTYTIPAHPVIQTDSVQLHNVVSWKWTKFDTDSRFV